MGGSRLAGVEALLPREPLQIVGNMSTTDSTGPRFQATGARIKVVRFVLIFVLSFLILQRGYILLRPYLGTPYNHYVNAVVSAAIINTLTPHERVTAREGLLLTRHTKIDIKKGCEGVEVMAILAAALLAYPMQWRHRWAGIAAGIVFVYLLNIVRIVSLFYIATYRPDLFDHAHATLWQTAVILGAAAFFFIWVDQVATRCSSAAMAYARVDSHPENATAPRLRKRKAED